MKAKYKALLALLATVFLFSIHVVIVRSEVSRTSSMFIFFLRMLVASVCFLPFFIARKVWKKPKFGKLMAISLFSSVNLAFFMWGIKYTTASASQMIYAAQPILTIFVANYFLKEKYTRKTILGVLLGFAGIIFIIYSSAAEKGETITGSLIGNFGIVIAMLGWLSYVLLSKKFSKYFSPIEIGSTSILVTLPISFMLFIVQQTFWQPVITISNRLFLISLYIGFFGTFLTYILIQYAIKILSPLTVNLSSYVQPIVVALLAGIFLSEKMTWSFLFGGMLVFLGVFLTATMEFYRRRK